MSAFGLLASPVGFEVVQSLRVPLSTLTAERFSSIVGDLESRVREQLASAGGDAHGSRVLVRLDMRYLGQGYEVEVLLPDRSIEGDPAAVLASLDDRFGAAYAAIFGMSFSDREIEIVAWKVEVQGPVPGGDAIYRLRTTASTGDALRGHRPAYFPELGRVRTPVYDRYRLARGATIDGPALVEENESTCVIGPGDRAHVDAAGHLVIDIAAAPAPAAASLSTAEA